MVIRMDEPILSDIPQVTSGTGNSSTAPVSAKPRPEFLVWYNVYCSLMAVLYLLVIGFGLFFLMVDPGILEMPPLLANLMGAAYVGMGFILAGLFGAAPFLPPKPWSWIYGIVCIGIGLSSPCCMPASIPLLIYWIKPETRRYFGRSDA
jgi:hypothetical protein